MAHRKNAAVAVPRFDAFLATRRGRRSRRKTTKGWDLLVRWKDGPETWIPLRKLKGSHLVDVVEYAKSMEIDDEPAFQWWIPFVLRKRDVILSAVNGRRTQRVTHKYGIVIPINQEHADAIDAKSERPFERGLSCSC